MQVIDMKIGGLKDTQRYFHRLDYSLPEAGRRTCAETAKLIRREMRRRVHRVSWKLYNNIFVNKRDKDTFVIYSSAPYAARIEEGGKVEGEIDLVALKKWAQKYAPQFIGETKEGFSKLAILAKHIEEQGTMPHPYMEPAVDYVINQIEPILNKNITDAIKGKMIRAIDLG